MTFAIMDGDPAVEAELDSFSRIFPLPYRVAIIIVAGRSCLSLEEIGVKADKRLRCLGLGI